MYSPKAGRTDGPWMEPGPGQVGPGGGLALWPQVGSAPLWGVRAPGADPAERGGTWGLIIVLWPGSGTQLLPRAGLDRACAPAPRSSSVLLPRGEAAWIGWGLAARTVGSGLGPARSPREKTRITQRDFLCNPPGAAAGGSRVPGSAPLQR